jgi:hypothetical protein|tara:strand:+ start:74 stop:832 length:759 start_codon:yes stop_codon:yes gene_type:complete
MKIKYLWPILWSLNTYAQFDFKYWAQARSYPSLGGSLNINLGHNYLLWGDQQQGVFYGLWRNSIEASSTIVVSHYQAQTLFYPVSFFGIGAGRQVQNSDYQDYTYYDCQKIRCKGNLTKNYTLAKLALGYAKFISTFRYKYSLNEYDQNKEQLPVGEYDYILQVSPNNEKQISRDYLLGIKHNKNVYGIASEYVEFLISKKSYNMDLIIYQKNLNSFKMLLGVGQLSTSDQKKGAIGIIRLTHEIAPSLSLF